MHLGENLHEVSDDKIYEVFEERGVYSNPEVLEWVKEFLAEVKIIEEKISKESKDPLVALDIGTGGSASLFGLLMRLRACWVISLDINKINIVNSRRKLKEKGIPENYDHTMQNAEYLGFKDEFFDLVCSVLTAHEISSKGREYEDKSRSFCEMFRACSVERYIIIVDTSEELHGLIRHSPETVARGKVSFISGEEVWKFLREAFPRSSINVRPFQSTSGTEFFIVVMRKISVEDISGIQNLQKKIEKKQGELEERNKIQTRMLNEAELYFQESSKRNSQ